MLQCEENCTHLNSEAFAEMHCTALLSHLNNSSDTSGQLELRLDPPLYHFLPVNASLSLPDSIQKQPQTHTMVQKNFITRFTQYMHFIKLVDNLNDVRLF